MNEDNFLLFSASSQRCRQLIEPVLRRPCGLFTDVDGTLSKIVPDPSAATPLPGVVELLKQACRTFEVVATVSGRTAWATWRLLEVADVLYIGNHCFEFLFPRADRFLPNEDDVQVVPAARPYAGVITTILDELDRRLFSRFPNVLVERKGVTASIHVDASADSRAARAAIVQALTQAAEPHGLRIVQGRDAIELCPPVDVDKGTVIEELVLSHQLRSALYLGDDAADLKAFRALVRLSARSICSGVAVAVAHPNSPPALLAKAHIVIESCERVPAFLEWLLAVARGTM
jgi:trehalose 6-phosphate phosphatase